MQMEILGQVMRIQHLLYVQNSRLHPFVGNSAEQYHFRMLSLLRESSSQSHAFCDGSVASQFVFARMGHGPGSNEVRLLELFKRDGDLRIMQRWGVCLANLVSQLGHGKPGDVQLILPSQRDKTIGLDAESLVELSSKIKLDVNHVTLSKPVKRTAVPHLVWTRCTIRYSGFRGRRCPSAGDRRCRLLLSPGHHRTCQRGKTEN